MNGTESGVYALDHEYGHSISWSSFRDTYYELIKL